MRYVRHGSTVTISYIGTLDNGRIFASTDAEGLLTITIGSDQVFPALERALIGMRAGETRNIVLNAAEAYGPRLAENIIKIDRNSFPVEKEIKVGQKLSIEFSGGNSRIMVVTEANQTEVTLDGNHPLAGLELTFAVTVTKLD